MSGGVRNLRAMFENKDTSTSPPADRGRSPGDSTGIASSGTSPRPLSKIRTSFVTVEKSGQIGLQLRRDTSGEPSLSKRRTSFSIDEEDSGAIAESKEQVAKELAARKNSSVITEAIPEAAIETPTAEVEKKLGNGKVVAKAVDTKVEPKKIASTLAATTNGSSKPVAAKPVEKASLSKTTTRPAPISTAKATAAPKKSPTKSPLPKTPTTPRGRGRPTEPRKEPEKRVEKHPRASLAPTQSSKPATRPTTTSGSAPRTRIQASPPQTGFVKPKPRSPTRPVKLPASLTAHTASSGSKTAGAAPLSASRQSLSRASGNVQHANSLQAHNAIARSPSRATTTASTLNRKPSIINKTSSRPSLGPPPSTLKKQSSRQSLPGGTPADDGFLARMMRPTTSSASKTLEKHPDTPPKRAPSVRRPVTRDGPSKTHEPSKASSATPKGNPVPTTVPVQQDHEPAAIVAKKSPQKATKSVSEASPLKPVIPAVPDLQNEPSEVGATFSHARGVHKSDVAGIKDDLALLDKEPKESKEIEVEEASVLPVSLKEPVKGQDQAADEEHTEEKYATEEVPITKDEPVVEKEATAQDDAADEELSALTEEASSPVEEEVQDEVQNEVEIAEPAKVATPEPTVTKDKPEVSEPVVEKEKPIEEEDQEENPEEDVSDELPEVGDTPEEPSLPSSKPTDPERLPTPPSTKSLIAEDPEDVKAREEIARLNAELINEGANDVE